MEEAVSIVKAGKQYRLPVSDKLMEQLGWKVGDQVEIVFERGQLKITKLEIASSQDDGS